MSWRDGCLPRPPAPVASDESFDFEAADGLGVALDRLRAEVDANLATRSRARPHLDDWHGVHRRTYDALRTRHEAVLLAGVVDAQIARLRVAWDEAVRAHHKAAAVRSIGAPDPT